MKNLTPESWMLILAALAVFDFFVLVGLILIMIHTVPPRSDLMRRTPIIAAPP